MAVKGGQEEPRQKGGLLKAVHSLTAQVVNQELLWRWPWAFHESVIGGTKEDVQPPFAHGSCCMVRQSYSSYKALTPVALGPGAFLQNVSPEDAAFQGGLVP